MSKPVKYKSQLSRVKGQLRIKTGSKLSEITYYVIPFIIFTTVLFSLNYGTFHFIHNLILLGFIFFNKRISDFLKPIITIDNTAIESSKDNISIPLYSINQLNIQVKFLEKGAEILIEQIRFHLKNPSDVALLTDEIERYTKLKFYDSQSVDKQIEILIFKSSSQHSADVKSFITLDDNGKEIRVQDNFNRINWFKIENNGYKILKTSEIFIFQKLTKY